MPRAGDVVAARAGDGTDAGEEEGDDILAVVVVVVVVVGSGDGDGDRVSCTAAELTVGNCLARGVSKGLQKLDGKSPMLPFLSSCPFHQPQSSFLSNTVMI